MTTYTLAQIGEFYKTSKFLRPPRPTVIEEYAEYLRNKTPMPPLVLGIYKGADQQEYKILVDGVHRYKAAILAKVPTLEAKVVHYATEAEALADQLKQNITHGVHVSMEARDARIKQLVEIFKWTTRQVAQVVGLAHSSVSRIVRGEQKGGKSGPRQGVRKRVLPPVSASQFIRLLPRLASAIERESQRMELIGVIYSPKTEAKQRAAYLDALQQVAQRLQALREQLQVGGKVAI